MNWKQHFLLALLKHRLKTVFHFCYNYRKRYGILEGETHVGRWMIDRQLVGTDGIVLFAMYENVGSYAGVLLGC